MTPTARKSVKPSRLGRRLLATFFGLALAGGLTTACSSADDTESTAAKDTGAEYPITVDTSHGEVTIPEQPHNIVALDTTAASHLIALGINPTTVMTYGDVASGRSPWIEEELQESALPDVYDYTTQNYEKISSLQPGLIVGASSSAGVDDFDKLNDIAPSVIASSSSGKTVSWTKKLNVIAQAFGLSKRAESIIEDIESSYREVGARVSGLSEKTYNWGLDTTQQISLGNGEVFGMFGMKANQDNEARESVSIENISKLDGDFLAIFTSDEGRTRLESIDGFSNLPAVKNGNILWADGATADAINAPSPMALKWLLEKLTPYIEALGK